MRPSSNSVSSAPKGILDPTRVPFVIWDGLGLGKVESGIYEHAHQLYEGLGRIGVFPVIAAPGRIFQENLWSGNQIAVPVGPLGRKIKAFWGVSTSRALNRLIPTPSWTTPIYHGLSNFNLPMRKPPGWKFVLTVHDIIPLICPSGVSSALRVQSKLLMSHALRLADVVICVSEWTKSTVLDRWPEVSDRAVVIPNGSGLDGLRTENGQPPGLSRAASDGAKRILTVSRWETYKNLDIVGELAERLPQRFRLHLVTDPKGEHRIRRRFAAAISRGMLELSVSLSQLELEQAFRSADIYMQPSLFEGYCLPAAHALRHGIPVIYHGGSALDEVVGPVVGFRVDPGSGLNRWEEAILAAEAITGTADYQARALQFMAQKPRWSSVASALRNVYNQLIT